MTQLLNRSRARRTSPITSVDDVVWEILYTEESEERQQALDEVCRIIYEHAVTHGFFKVEESIEKQNTTLTPSFISSPLCL